MPDKNNNKKKASYSREEPPGFLEKIGVKYCRYLEDKSGTAEIQNINIDDP